LGIFIDFAGYISQSVVFCSITSYM